MYDNRVVCAPEGQMLGGGLKGHKSPTLAENIDMRIANLKEQVERLERVKGLLAEPAGLLNVPLEDLRFAMNY